MLSGVPQGCHLGPLLISLFKNGLPNMINFANILLYADDDDEHENIKIDKCMRFSGNNFIAGY